MLREADKKKRLKTFSLGIIEDVIKHSLGLNMSTCFLTGNCHKFLNITSDGTVYATCNKSNGIQLCDLSNNCLCTAINTSTAPIKSVLDQLDNVYKNDNITFGPGCPNYSYGKGDIYLNVLKEISEWYKLNYGNKV